MNEMIVLLEMGLWYGTKIAVCHCERDQKCLFYCFMGSAVMKSLGLWCFLRCRWNGGSFLSFLFMEFEVLMGQVARRPTLVRNESMTMLELG